MKPIRKETSERLVQAILDRHPSICQNNLSPSQDNINNTPPSRSNEIPLNNLPSHNSDPEPLLQTQNQNTTSNLLLNNQKHTNKPSNNTSTPKCPNQQTPPSTSINPAGILGHQTFGSSTKNASNSFYNIFGKPSMDSPNISTTTSSPTIQEHRPKYAQPDKFDGDPRNYQKWKEDCSLYMLAHNNNFPDEHTAIMFMLYHMDKKALV